MQRPRQVAGISVLVVSSLVLSGCGGSLVVLDKSFSTLQGTGQIETVVTFNQPVDSNTVVPGTSLILAGAQDSNAQGNLVWNGDFTRLTFTTTKAWGQITGQGGTDAGFTLTLKSTVKSKTGDPMQQCAKGSIKVGGEPAGDCKLVFVIPG